MSDLLLCSPDVTVVILYVSSQPWLWNNASRGGMAFLFQESTCVPAAQTKQQKAHNPQAQNIPAPWSSPRCVSLTWNHWDNRKPNKSCQGTHLQTRLNAMRWKKCQARHFAVLTLMRLWKLKELFGPFLCDLQLEDCTCEKRMSHFSYNRSLTSQSVSAASRSHTQTMTQK